MSITPDRRSGAGGVAPVRMGRCRLSLFARQRVDALPVGDLVIEDGLYFAGNATMVIRRGTTMRLGPADR